MKLTSLFFTVFFACVAHAKASEYVTCLPASVEVTSPGEFRSTSSEFSNFNDGSIGILVRLNYHLGKNSDTSATAVFRPVGGALIRRGNDLYWQTSSEAILVAHHEWWYGPYWHPADNVSIIPHLERVTAGHAWQTFDVSASFAIN